MPFIVFNKHTSTPDDRSWCDEVVGVMRPAVLSNPFSIKAAGGVTRDRILTQYRKHLHQEILKPQSPIRHAIDRLAKDHQQGKTIGLLCCCAPLPCHADIVVRAALWLSENPSITLETSDDPKNTDRRISRTERGSGSGHF